VRTASGAAPGERHLDWDGCFNVRDLGGLPAAGGRVTRRGAIVRADALDRLTLVGVAPEDVVADYVPSAERQPARYAALGLEDPSGARRRRHRPGTRARPPRRASGLADADVAALRERMLEPAAG
jgi:hypothetical protein